VYPLSDTMQHELFNHLPIYHLRLVRDREVCYDDRVQVIKPEDAYKYVLRDYFITRHQEVFTILMLDTSNKVIGIVEVSSGGMAASIVEPRAVFAPAILHNAAAVICAHNHPSGNPEPSTEDLRVTRQLVDAGCLMGIPVHDHLICTEETFTSLAERHLLAAQ